MKVSRIFTSDDCLVWILTSLMFVYVCGQSRDRSRDRGHRSGRQLCTRYGREWARVPETQSYRRPVYRDGRTTYQTAYRTVFRMRLQTKRVQGCCPGWRKRNPQDKFCLIPECKTPCEHGKCIAPDICMCDAGFSGHRCHIELDECTGRHKCHQKCINTYGSYKCDCHEGFKLAEDKLTCNLCLTCIPEFIEINDKVNEMSKKINSLEEEKKALQQNLTSAVSQYQEVVSAFKVKDVTPRTTHAPTTTRGYGLYDDMPMNRLTSLSEQISMLEERMADCSCNRDDQYNY